MDNNNKLKIETMEIKINIVKVATEIAHESILDVFGKDPGILYKKDDGSKIYKDEIQKRFDEYCDLYYDILLDNKIK